MIDTFLFYNELDLLEVRLRTLSNVVDSFVLTECHKTFSGHDKPMVFAENRERFAPFEQKIIYNPVGEEELDRLRRPEWQSFVTDREAVVPHKHNGRPAKSLRQSLLREINHRDAMILGLHNLANDHDLILLSDVDEIPDPAAVRAVSNAEVTQPHYFRMKWYLYWLNNRVDRDWYGTVAFEFHSVRGRSMDLLRYSSDNRAGVPGEIIEHGGWHFSYLGGSEAIADKLMAMPYQGHRAELTIFLNRLWPNRIARLLRGNKDLLYKGRRFQTVVFDESFPRGLLELPDVRARHLAPDGH